MARRPPNVFGLSFLDSMTCGFGAVLLVFMILTSRITDRTEQLLEEREAAETRDARVVVGKKHLAALRNTIDEAEQERIETAGLARAAQTEIDRVREEIADLRAATSARESSVRRLQADLRSLEEESKRASARSVTPDEAGDRVLRRPGQGERQYLTGLRMSGGRVLILVDSSASMLDRSVVNVLRRRNMPAAERRRAPKWRRAVATVEWLLTQLPPSSRFQLYRFDTAAEALVPETQGRWLDVADGRSAHDATKALRTVAPRGGTSLWAAFDAASRLDPKPDAIFLVVDGLPTQGERIATKGTISGRDRERLFAKARQRLPADVPVNVVLLPMEGDPAAASAYWSLAHQTNGALVGPSEDWP